jgi:polysaccharide pyruvyl transferase CsaB
MAKPPRILVCGWAGAGNIGDELLTDWVVERVEALGGRVLLTTRSIDDTRHRHPSVTPVRWRPRDLVRLLVGVDGICVGPGGIIQDSTSLWSLPAHLSRALVGRVRKRPVAGVGLGAEPLGRRSSRWVLRRALAKSVGVVVRDTESAVAMSAAGVTAVVASDLVFGLAPLGDRPTSADGTRDGKRDGMVVAVGPSVRPGLVAPVARRHDHSGVAEVAEAVAALSRRIGGAVSVAAFRGEPDAAFGRALVERLGDSARMVPGDPRSVREAIAGARVVVGSRYHAAVLGLVESTPVLVRSDETKLASLTRQIDDDARIRMLRSWADLVDVELADPAGLEPFDTAMASVRPNEEALASLLAAASRRRR